MELTGPNLQQFFQLVDFTFRDAQLKTPTYWNMFAQKVPSKTEKNVYPWLSQIPGLREWLGPRIVNNIATRDYSLTNKQYEDTIGIDRNKLADDTYGFFEGITSELGQRVAEFPDLMLAKTLEAGTSTLGWDGQYFFDTDHPVDIDDPTKGVFINNFVGTVNSQNYDLAADPKGVFRAIRSQMMQYKRDDGNPLGIVGNVLMVAPGWEGPAKDAVEAVTITDIVRSGGNPVAAGSPTNVFYGAATVIVNPWLTKQDAGYLLCTTRGIKPLLYQDREGPNFVPRVDPAADNVFLQRRYEWGVDLRAAFGYTFPFMALRFAAT